MALWAFHNNPGIGGFGENNPVIFDGSRTNTSERGDGLKRKKQRGSSKCGIQIANGSSNHSKDHSNKNSTAISFSEYLIGESDLICQIIKELVDNAVDACRSPLSERRHEMQKKRIRVDIVSAKSHPSKDRFNDVLQLTVTDTGCGMENIQKCVNAFQTSKDGKATKNRDQQNINSNTSGRYGIGLTLCLLHAQRCVPNSRACIASATRKSKFRTKAFFEVDKEEDFVKCVQEEVVNLSTSRQESGTCVSLLVPGGKAAKLAWPRLQEYFTRFRLCTKLNFELDVYAPTLSKLPIYIRSSQIENQKVGNLSSLEERENESELEISCLDSDGWEDPLDGDDNEEASDRGKIDLLTNNKQRQTASSNEKGTAEIDPERYEFFNASQSFWTNREIRYTNVARSIRDIRHYEHQTPPSGREANRKSEVQLEVKMAVCPHINHSERGTDSTDSAATTSKNSTSEIENDATLKLIRIVNGVPIMENAEAHSCGLVHGIANKSVWGSFGLDIDRTSAAASNDCSRTPSFVLRDSSLIAPFIKNNSNHRQLKINDYEKIYHLNHSSQKKKRKKDTCPQNDFMPANVRIGTILIVVEIHAAPNLLPLPSLSKGRLPLNHQPIDSALQLGLRDCLTSLQSTNSSLFLTTFQLRTVERDVRYIPGIASAISRIIFRSRNKALRSKGIKLMSKESTSIKKANKICTSEIQRPFLKSQMAKGGSLEINDSKIEISELAAAFESRLRLAIKARNDLKSKNRNKRQKSSDIKDEEYHDFDTVNRQSQIGEKSLQVSNSPESSSTSLSSDFSFHCKSFQQVSEQPQTENCSSDECLFPMKEIVIKNCPNFPKSQDDNDVDEYFDAETRYAELGNTENIEDDGWFE